MRLPVLSALLLCAVASRATAIEEFICFATVDEQAKAKVHVLTIQDDVPLTVDGQLALSLGALALRGTFQGELVSASDTELVYRGRYDENSPMGCDGKAFATIALGETWVASFRLVPDNAIFCPTLSYVAPEVPCE